MKLKEKIRQMKEKKGMNTIETVIIVVIILLIIMTMLDLMEVTQKMSATTSAANYVTRLVGRQGGISNAIPANFSSYGHGSYVTTESACDILNISLQKAFSVTDGDSVLGDQVKIYIQPYDLVDVNNTKFAPRSGAKIELSPTSEFGVYIHGSHIDPNLLISQESVLFHKTYYVITAEMYYNAFTLERLITFDDSYFTKKEEFVKYKKVFTRFIIPTYYNREYDTYVESAIEWYVK